MVFFCSTPFFRVLVMGVFVGARGVMIMGYDSVVMLGPLVPGMFPWGIRMWPFLGLLLFVLRGGYFIRKARSGVLSPER